MMREQNNVMESDDIELMGEFFDRRIEKYDEIHHQSNISWGIEIRDIVSKFVPSDGLNILDLGAGTGIELEQIFNKFPNSKITCIDISEQMLSRLKKKFNDKNIKVVKADFLKMDLGRCKYDVVVSVMALHHFLLEKKEELYKNIYNSLKESGLFINSDYIVNTLEEENFYRNQYLNLAISKDLLIHFDIPLSYCSEIKALQNAGFKNINNVFENKKTKVILAYKN